jgi:cardiolipin hydrolase
VNNRKMEEIEKLLTTSLEDFALSRSEKKVFKKAIKDLHGDVAEQAKVRQLAFRLAGSMMEEVGQICAMDWLQGIIKLLYASENEVKASAYFSPGEDCLHRIRRLIGEAQTSLDICVFTITDDRIVRKLTEALARKVRIRVISDDDKSKDLGSDLARLERLGIDCLYDRTSAHMHHKFAVADNDILLTGSYNWTRSAATQNDENIIITNNPKLVRDFTDQFAELWRRLS